MTTAAELSGRFDNLHGDEDYEELSPAELRDREVHIAKRAKELLTDRAFWKSAMECVNPLSSTVEEMLPRLVGMVDQAVNENMALIPGGEIAPPRFAVTGILTALHYIQREAKIRARERATEESDLSEAL